MSEVSNEIAKQLIKYGKETKVSILLIWIVLMIPALMRDTASLFVWLNGLVFLGYDIFSYIYGRIPDDYYERNSQKVKNAYIFISLIFATHWGIVTGYIFANPEYEDIYISTAIILAFSSVAGFTVWLLSPLIGKMYLTTLYLPSIFVLASSYEVGGVITAIFIFFCIVMLIQQGDQRAKYVLNRMSHQLNLDKQANRYKEISDKDPLTGVYNRRYFDQQISSLLENAHHRGSCVSLLVIDLDHFKEINDMHGHDIGDACLQEAVDLIQHEIRFEKDTLCRFGGEEFVVLLPDANKEKSKMIAERICKRFGDHPHQIQNLPISLTVSIGMATSTMNSDADALFKLADQAMYQAKNSGRDRSMHITDL